MSPDSLEADGLAMRAGGTARGRLLFERLSFRVSPGERWVVLGRNGAGKSTLLAGLAGLLPADRGSVKLAGTALADWPGDALAERRAWCPASWFDPFSASVEETVRLAADRTPWWLRRRTADGAALEAVLAALDLAALRDADVRRLSAGERQRVALATTLMQGAPLLLLDEPTSHLDPAHRLLVCDRLRRHAQGGGAVVASLHDLDLAWRLASHAVLLDGRGRAIAGERDAVMTPAALDAAFGVAVRRVEVGGSALFAFGAAEPP